MTIDIIILVFIGFFTFKYFRQGLLKSALYAVFNILTMFSGYIIANRYASVVSEKFVYDKVYASSEKYIAENLDMDTLLSGFANGESQGLWNSLLGNLSTNDVANLANIDTQTAITTIQTEISTTISYGISYMITFILALILVSIAFKLIANTLSILLKATGLSILDKTIGGVIGFGISLAISCLIIWTSYNVAPSLQSGIYSQEELSKTVITKTILEKQPEFFTNLTN